MDHRLRQQSLEASDDGGAATVLLVPTLLSTCWYSRELGHSKGIMPLFVGVCPLDLVMGDQVLCVLGTAVLYSV
ncbi:hypothetical protein EK904_009689 [Melospiza melodia maxima]|nr:hypothetical protein EK904_009689 [Melospiza melodia maxima]